MENFFECIKTRKEPNAPVEAGVAAARAGHIGNLRVSTTAARPRGRRKPWAKKKRLNEALLSRAQLANPNIPEAHWIAMILKGKRQLVRRRFVGWPLVMFGGT